MSFEDALKERADSKCELCRKPENLIVYPVPPNKNDSLDESILICTTCLDQIENLENIEANHWRCLNDSMWSPTPAVQVMAWRMLNHLDEAWANDLLDMLYIEDDVKKWAMAGSSISPSGEDSLDSNGAKLSAGDSVTLIKDLTVKGANFTGKRGTLVKGISLTETPEQIEGNINGTRVVLAVKYLKKA